MSQRSYRLGIVFLLIAIVVSLPKLSKAQRQFEGLRRNPTSSHQLPNQQGDWPGEYTFVRIIYDSPDPPFNEYNRYFGGAWRVDYPDADENFMMGIREWAGSNLYLAAQPVQVRATDERLFNYPFAYIVEPGHMQLTNADAAALREYLMRGGFLFLDDFHGDFEYQHAREEIKKILPEYEVKDLPLTHPVFHSYFDLDGVVQVPGIAALVRGVTYEKGGVTPHYMGVENKQGRLMIFLTVNCDLGDAWEWINDSLYPAQYGVVAYKVGMNVITYAMSH